MSPIPPSSGSLTTSSTSTTTQPATTPHKINGPLSTLPPPLSIPPRDPAQSLFRYALTTGKTFLTFYKTAGKAIYTNFRLAQPPQRLVDEKYDGSLRAAIDARALSRHDFLLLHRSWFDIKRVPVFGLVFAICGEFTPLVVLGIPSVVPYVARIPKQIKGYQEVLEKRRKVSFGNLTLPPPEGEAERGHMKEKEKEKDGGGMGKAGIGEATIVDSLQRMQLLHISWSLGLSSRFWDYLGGTLPGLPTPILRRKVRRRVEYLLMDDTLMEREGGVEALGEVSTTELERAAIERGIDVTGRDEEGLRQNLAKWLGARRRGICVERLLLTRPSVW